jgi:uncharacterized protein (DUF305 family)
VIVVRVAVALAVAALAITGCGGDDETDDGATATTLEAGEAEVEFLQAMDHHHAQAVQLGTQTARFGADAAVRGLALDVAVSQAREQGQVQAMLVDRGVVPGSVVPDGTEVHGMIPSDELAAAVQLRGAELDAAFLALMVPHHEGAVAMADALLARDDVSPALRALAGAVATAQQEELAELQLLIG